MKEITINIARDFTKYPGGRFKDDGPFSGEALRDDILIPALRKYDIINLELDGPLGYGSGVLEECFGGLIREAGFSMFDLSKRINFISDNTKLLETIREYMDDADLEVLRTLTTKIAENSQSNGVT